MESWYHPTVDQAYQVKFSITRVAFTGSYSISGQEGNLFTVEDMGSLPLITS